MSFFSKVKKSLGMGEAEEAKEAQVEQQKPENSISQRPKLISHIVAFSNNRVIGHKNELPWRLPKDLKHFKKLTTGKTILMGRNTYESIGKPLPNRRNLVLSRQTDLKIEGCEVVTSLEQAYAACKDDPELMIIGGEKVYTQTLEQTDRIYATLVDCDITGDAFFPEVNLNNWKLDHSKKCQKDDKHQYDYSFLQLDRR